MAKHVYKMTPGLSSVPPDYCNGSCIMKKDLGCYECYRLKGSMIQYCDEGPSIADIEAYELELSARREE